MWSGSEELWTRSAENFSKKGYRINVVASYAHETLDRFHEKPFNLSNRYKEKSLLQRTLERVTPLRFSKIDLLKKHMQQVNPELVILSRGNNLDSDGIMRLCIELDIPYFTITQLVTEVHFLYLNNFNLPVLRKSYLGARMNFFVSVQNRDLNNLMLGRELNNSEVIFNPSKITASEICPFPQNNIYKVGLVGRIECFHKGYDLLLQLMSKNKWRSRPIEFNVYGSGPHVELLEDNISRLAIMNVYLRGHVANVMDVWKENHILFMPSRMEGQALALIEAMFCERAAIVTSVGGARELITEEVNGYIAEAATVKCLDEALEKAWKNRNNWKSLGLSARDSISEKYPTDAALYLNDKIEHLI